jgi:PEP-CTERM putative exosortase interaction domain
MMASMIILGLCFSSSNLFADFGQVQQFVKDYNGHNDGTGYKFRIATDSGYSSVNGNVYQGETRVTFTGETPDLSAYSSKTSGNNYFQTFCIQTQEYVETGKDYLSQLNLSGNANSAKTSTRGTGSTTITEGTATLYRLFATGELNYKYTYGNDRAGDASILQAALWKLQGQTTDKVGKLTSNDWKTNKYLAYLLTVDSDKDYWLSSYDPGKDTSGYAVLAMQNTDIKFVGAQDFLYLVENPSTDVPEPATVALWLAAIGGTLAWRRKQQQRKTDC